MLLFADGFDHYGNTANMTVGTYLRADVTMNTNPAYVRTGGSSIDVSGGDNADRGLVIPVSTQAKTLGVGFAILTTANPPKNNGLQYVLYGDTGKPIISAAFNGNLGIDIICGGVTLGSTPPLILTPGSFSYPEIAFTIDEVQGAVIVRNNNQVVLNIQGVNTVGDGGDGVIASAGFIKPGGVNSTWPSWYVDDFVMWDTAGALQNTFFGDIRCRTLLPASNGANQAWQAVGEPQAFECINNVPPAPNLDYISSANPADVSSFGLTPLPGNTGQVFGMMVFGNLNKADAGVCTVEIGIGSQGQTDMGQAIAPGVGAAYYQRAIQADPNGNKAWTAASVNAAQALVERVS